MTKEISELTEKLKVAVAKNVELENKKTELLRNIKEVMYNNYKNILFDELKLYCGLCTDFKNKYKGCSALYMDSKDYGIKLKFYHSDGKEVFLKIPTDSNSYYYLGLKGEESELSYLKGCSEREVEYISPYLDTEEHSLRLLERIRKGYAEILRQFLEFLDRENTELYEAVEDLAQRLEKSSTVENKEDETVEIHLGNKTFRGSIVEQ